MRVTITGPRGPLSADLKSGWMHIELDLEVLPRVGDVIILNSGSSYYVKDIMWWVTGPENDAYWSRGDYRVEGEYETAHITVDYDQRPERYGYPAGLDEGRKRGGDEFLSELRGLVDLARDAGTADGLAIINAWLARKEQAAAERQETERQQAARAAEIFAQLRERKEGPEGPEAPPA